MDARDVVVDVRHTDPGDPEGGHASEPEVPRGDQMALLPARVRWKADNYNNLMEQPTVFYAVAIVYSLLTVGGGWPLRFAWIYVGLRVTHSLVQATWNKIEVRFVLFVLSSLVLVEMTVRALILILDIMRVS